MTKCKYTIDRFEGDLAVLLLRKDETIMIDVPRSQLPSNVKVGDILEVHFNSNRKIEKAVILKDETNAAKKTADDLLKKILDKNK